MLISWICSLCSTLPNEVKIWYFKASLEIQTWVGNASPVKLNTGVLAISKRKWNLIYFTTTTIKFILSPRLIGPQKDWASAQWFLKGSEESIYGKLYKNNMDGLSSFYPVVEGIDYLVNSDTEVALFHFFNVHSYQEYECKVNIF